MDGDRDTREIALGNGRMTPPARDASCQGPWRGLIDVIEEYELGTRLIQKSVSNLRDKGPHSHPHDEDDGYTVARHPFDGRLPIYRMTNQRQSKNHK